MPQVTVLIEPASAPVAEPRAQVIFLPAARAMIGELSRRHRQEQSVGTLDQLDVADDEGVVEGERAERFESAARVAAQVDAHFSELHGTPRVEMTTNKM